MRLVYISFVNESVARPFYSDTLVLGYNFHLPLFNQNMRQTNCFASV